MRQSCVFLTMNNLDGFVSDDGLAIRPLQKLGVRVEFQSWRARNIDWSSFDGVVIRSTWDYQKDPQLFLSVLESIDNSGTLLANDLRLVQWNLSKTYLNDLQQWQIPVVPTQVRGRLDAWQLSEDFRRFGTDQLVVKPVVGASAEHTYRLTPDSISRVLPSLEASFPDNTYLIQPFRRSILQEGEYSVCFFAGQYSHSILKKPAQNDFRSQEEYGAQILSIEPGPDLLRRATRALDALSPLPLYARVDLIRNDSKDLEVMELELIEPALYLRTHPLAATKFAKAVSNWLRIGTPAVD